jgi:tetratricopeptide (TPR) repeat protein
VSQLGDTHRLASPDPTGYAEFVNHDLAKAIAFLSQLAVADVLVYQQDTESVTKLYQAAMRLAGAEPGELLWDGMAEFTQQLIRLRYLTEDAARDADVLKQLLDFMDIVRRAPQNRHLVLLANEMMYEVGGMSAAQKEAALRRIEGLLEDLSLPNSDVTYIDGRTLRAKLLADLGRAQEARQSRVELRDRVRQMAAEVHDFGLTTREIELDVDLQDYQAAHRLAAQTLATIDPDKNVYWARHFQWVQAYIYQGEENYPQALAAARFALKYSRTPLYRAQALRAISNTYGTLHDEAMAKHYLELLISEGIASSWDYNNLASYYSHDGHCAQAANLYRQALEMTEFIMPRHGLINMSLCLTR